ncbi:MAG: hypothetical protein IJE97_01525, partial [Thermoguttaceae bacterium]|nr:hypothetical protein [Thermoguttaceae bacterium]
MRRETLMKRKLRFERLENRELLSATTWDVPSESANVAEIAANSGEDGAVAASPIVVDTARDVVDANDGVTSLREAIAALPDGGTIAFAKSLRDQTLTLESQIEITQSVMIDASDRFHYNGGARDPNGTGITIDGQKATRLFEIAVGAELTAIGVSFVNGEVVGMANHDHGGAFHVRGTLNLYDCLIADSNATLGGGAVSVEGTDAAFNARRVVFEGCGGGEYGGAALGTDGATVSVVDCEFRLNGINYEDGRKTGGGGAVAIRNASFTSLRSTYRDNDAWFGGALFFTDSTVYMAGDLVVGNGGTSDMSAATGVGSYNGGGIDIHGGAATIVNSTIAANVANNSGGGIYVNASDGDVDLTLINTIVVENVALGNGGDDIQTNEGKGAASANAVVVGRYVLSTFAGWAATSSDNVAYDGDADALFVDWANRDARILPGSQAHNAGAAALAVDADGAALLEDWDWNVRVAENAIDLGAFEVSASNYYALEAPTDFVGGEFDPETRELTTSWKDASGGQATRFRVEYSLDGENYYFSEFVAANETGVAERIAKISYADRHYYFRVRAEIATGAEADDWSAWTPFVYRQNPPTQPGAIRFGAYDQATGRLEMSWGDSTDETYYRVEYSRDGGATWNNSGTVDAGVTERVATLSYRYSEYSFRVRAENGAGASEWTYGTFAPPALTAPTSPASVVFDSFNAETGELAMSWTGASNADKIRVEFTYDGGKTWSHSQTLSGDATGRVAQIGWASRTYQFRVCAINAANKNDADAFE